MSEFIFDYTGQRMPGILFYWLQIDKGIVNFFRKVFPVIYF